jgi:hypothetical protein
MTQEALTKSIEKANESMSGEIAKIDLLKSQITSESLSRKQEIKSLKS